jgi:hypothetical protein
MPRRQIEKADILRELADGLIIRRARAEDAEAVIAFNEKIFKQPGAEGEQEDIAGWINSIFGGKHPTLSARDFIIIEDLGKKRIISSLCLISQTWSYGGIKFGVGRPEVVATLPDYRRRGLVRQQFEILHQWSARRKEKVQAITGIPYFYRQFGYEMALELFSGFSCGPGELPKVAKDQQGEYRVRPAREKDLPFIARLYRQGMRRFLVSCERNEKLWRFELKRRLQGFSQPLLRRIETRQGEAVGFLMHQGGLQGKAIGASLYELKPGRNWLAVTPAVVDYLWKTGETYAARDKRDLARFSLWLGESHPAYQALPRLKRESQPYAYYLRVADIPDFLRHIAPVLEQRLAASIAPGHSGELTLSFFRAGASLTFEKGKLSKIEPWQPNDKAAAFFPDLTFLQLLFGYRSLEELNYAFPDCRVREDEAGVLLTLLFPKQASHVLPVD